MSRRTPLRLRRGRGARRALLCALAVSLAATGTTGLGTLAAGAALARHCSAHPVTSAADYQAVADGRNASFGVGDITSAVGLPDGRRFFTLGDTDFDDLAPGGAAGPLTGFGNNSAWVQNGNCFTLLARAAPGVRSWLLPPQTDGSVYWPGAAVVVGNRLYVFLTRLFLDRPFGRPVGSAIAAFDLPSLALARITTIPFSAEHPYGNGAVYDDGYLYAYASKRPSCKLCFAANMYVGRVPADEIQLPSAWRYRAGSGWTADPNAATPVLPVAVSNTDVQHYGNGFLLVTKPLGIVDPIVEARWSPNPIGPWRDLGTIYSIPQPPPSYVSGFTYQQAYTYNPTLLAWTPLTGGGLLMSYDVNTFDPAEAQRDGRLYGPRFVAVHLPPPPAAAPRPRVDPGPSPWAPTFGVDRLGRVHAVNGGVNATASHTRDAVGIARTPSGLGGWVVAGDGGVFAFGDARYYGSMGGRHLNRPIVGIAATPTGHGYWLVASDGGIFSFGDAHFFGSTGNIRLNRPILAMAASPTGAGYWFVASDGGVFSFGDARFLGSKGGAPPPAPVSGMAATPDGRGYWLTTLLGQVYAFGDAAYSGGIPSPPAALCIGIVAAPGGYRLVDTSGNVFLHGATQGRAHIASAASLIAAA